MFGHLGQVLSVSHWLWLVGIVLQTPHHRHNVLLLEHDVEECSLVDEEEGPEYVIEVVEARGVFQVFADVEELEEFWDVVVALHGLDKALPVHGGRYGRRDQVKDFFQFAQFAERELDDGAVVQVWV